jgi:hypothetical protein
VRGHYLSGVIGVSAVGTGITVALLMIEAGEVPGIVPLVMPRVSRRGPCDVLTASVPVILGIDQNQQPVGAIRFDCREDAGEECS